MNGELTYFREHSMVNNDSEVFIFVPKPLAQRARQYLSNENIFINHKSFEKSSIIKTGEDALGIPIKLEEDQKKAVDQGHQNSMKMISGGHQNSMKDRTKTTGKAMI